MSTDFEDQADSFLMYFWNGNGNVAISTIVFSSPEQAKAWGEKNLRELFPAAVIRKDKQGVSVWKDGEESLGWKVLPALSVGAEVDVSSISTGHVESVR